MKPFNKDVTIRDKYFPAMDITNPNEAREYFDACVQHCMSFGKSRDDAEKIELANLGYVSGYFNSKVMERVENLFGAIHPIFSSIKDGILTTKQAFEMGKNFAKGKS